MSRFSQSCTSIVATLLLFLSAGCTSPTPGLPNEGASSATPIEDRAHDSKGTSPQAAALIQKSVVGNDLPFGSTEVLPSGTLLSVRLKSPLTAQAQESNTRFEAIVDDPVILDGNTLIPRGAVVSGRVGQVRISTVRPDRGYVRLTLESLNLDGLDLPLKTANLFARQKSGDLKSGTIRLEKGRRLTFQTTEPFYPDAQNLSTAR